MDHAHSWSGRAAAWADLLGHPDRSCRGTYVVRNYTGLFISHSEHYYDSYRGNEATGSGWYHICAHPTSFWLDTIPVAHWKYALADPGGPPAGGSGRAHTDTEIGRASC